jgi:hypothetical protein
MNLQPININLQNKLSAQTRRNMKWIRMQLTFRPCSTGVGALGINNGLFPNLSIVPVYLKALHNNDGDLHPLITNDMLRTAPEATTKDL